MSSQPAHSNQQEAHALPQPTVWPVVMAAGMTIMAAGVVIGIIVFVGGAVLFGLAVWGWTRDLLTAPGGAATLHHEQETAPRGGPRHG